MPESPDLQGWTPVDAANRAAQALFGLGLVSMSSSADAEFINAYSKASMDTLVVINSQTDDENVQAFLSIKRQFTEVFKHVSLSFVKSDVERTWNLFLERFDMHTCQLRINVSDMFECLDIPVIAQSSGRDAIYFGTLPVSSELVFTLATGGLRMEIVIPPRLLMLDMILMLVQALAEHQRLERVLTSKTTSPLVDLKFDGRLDTYSRQTLILSATVIDNVMSEYGCVVEAWLSSRGHDDVMRQLIAVHKKGVTERLMRLPSLWSSDIGSNPPADMTPWEDMINIVQIRNRLVHADGRVSGWHAFQLSPKTGEGWRFSNRLDAYLHASYGIQGTYIGYEYALARFCVDTTVAVIHGLHRLLFPGQQGVPWLDFTMGTDGKIDLDALIQKERLLQGFSGY